MRQSRWMKLFSEYGFKAKYHLGKENVVVESWSRKKSEAKNEFWIDIVRVICEVFVDLKLAIRQDLGFIPSGNVVLSSTYVGKILGAD
ncbi:hypothetical protein Tco_0729601 [Tanacetum coccineum]|uniref:Reverse transcriptase RNase H-like domain-containing protein n=1 Tax=Tanacetum coccineum TaxID=301880 RepID=A0ABQ4YRS6_9ASTR